MPVRILHHWDQKIDTAESVAKELAYSYSLKDCATEDAVAFRAWLAGDTDEMPETMPRSKYVAYCFVTETNQRLCQLSQYSPFPERLCAYAVINGQVTTVKYLVEHMLHSMGMDYTLFYEQYGCPIPALQKKNHENVLCCICRTKNQIGERILFWLHPSMG